MEPAILFALGVAFGCLTTLCALRYARYRRAVHRFDEECEQMESQLDELSRGR